jgi:hypothetical protein
MVTTVIICFTNNNSALRKRRHTVRYSYEDSKTEVFDDSTAGTIADPIIPNPDRPITIEDVLETNNKVLAQILSQTK